MRGIVAALAAVAISIGPTPAFARQWYLWNTGKCSKAPSSPAEVMRLWDSLGVAYEKTDQLSESGAIEAVSLTGTSEGNVLVFFGSREVCTEMAKAIGEMARWMEKVDREKLKPYE